MPWSQRNLGEPEDESEREAEDDAQAAEQQASDNRSNHTGEEQFSDRPRRASRGRRASAADSGEQHRVADSKGDGNLPTGGDHEEDRKGNERGVLHRENDDGEAAREGISVVIGTPTPEAKRVG